jgi:hypothetical protein
MEGRDWRAKRSTECGYLPPEERIGPDAVVDASLLKSSPLSEGISHD